ncbi:CUGBP Elav-like member 3 [Tritrichomonas musculus]|uniref:CUGBP Elav-like member 3 n=1 Tax=Tritrichomonas musculus TaxID=1915356 RepID=A0ABR2JVF9_9EUKA
MTTADQSNISNKTIYVSNIPFSADGRDLAAAFERFGEITQSRIISGYYRGQNTSRGFGFVDFKTEEGFNNAVNFKEPIKIQSDRGERTLRVSAARPRVNHPRDTIYLGRLAENTNEQNIRDAFKDYTITEVRIPQARNPRQEKKYFAFVKFASEEICKKVMELKNVSICGKDIRILSARPQVRFPFMRRGPRSGYRGRRGGFRGRRGYRGRGRGRRAQRQGNRPNQQQQQGQQQGQQQPPNQNQQQQPPK